MIILGGLRTSVYKEISLLEIAGIFQLLKRHVTSITELLLPTKIHWRQTEATTALFWYWIYWYLYD